MNALQRVLAWLRSLLSTPGAATGSGRTSGRPTSANGASSFHLGWELPPGSFTAASVDLEIDTPPVVTDLYFWAVQADFGDASAETAGAHLGLQWNRRHPGGTAANWGGYHASHLGGAILDGSASPLPSAPNDPNTRDYAWRAGTRYRLEISPMPQRAGWWRGTITDLDAGEQTVVRDLDGGGDRIRAVTMWSEVFARCDAPSVRVRWSRLRLRTEAGAEVAPLAVTVNYQSRAAGGCDNTTAALEGATFTQTTSTRRIVAQGARLEVL